MISCRGLVGKKERLLPGEYLALTMQRYDFAKGRCLTLADFHGNFIKIPKYCPFCKETLRSSINPNPFFIRRDFNLYPKPLCPLQGRGLKK